MEKKLLEYFSYLDLDYAIIYLSLSMLWKNSADNILKCVFLFFPERRLWQVMQIVSWGKNLHEMSYPITWEK